MYLVIIYLSLVTAFTTLLYSHKIGGNGACLITIGGMGITNILSFFIFAEVGLAACPSYIHIFNWIDFGYILVEWAHIFDSLTCTMLVVVTSVSFAVHIFSASYMKEDPDLPRFMAYLSLFTFFMLILVTSSNFLQLFVGWEGVGLCSYLLINFWYHRIQANKSAIKAMLVNRVGDIGLSIAIFCIFSVYKTLDFSIVFITTPYMLNKTLNIAGFDFFIVDFICFFIFFGIIGKSAQFLLHSWLPDAMEGPTPVSALIHAATMVTAGVFLLARCSPLFEYSPTMLAVLEVFGVLTVGYASLVGAVQLDLKKIIAYSTCSQLGYMIYAAGISAYSESIFHLASHAFFKAMLFISAGVIIHALNGEQDIRNMGGLAKRLPFASFCFITASIALMGIPFLSGFFSKDLVIEFSFYVIYWPFEMVAYFINYIALISTVYSLSSLDSVFFNDSKDDELLYDADLLSSISLFLLFIGSIFFGFWCSDLLVGFGTDFWNDCLYVVNMNHPFVLLHSEFITEYELDLPFLFSIFGVLLMSDIEEKKGCCGVNCRYRYNGFNKETTDIFERKLNFDRFITSRVVSPILNLSYTQTYQNLDRGVFELIGPNGIAKSLYVKYSFLNRLHYDFIFDILFLIILFIFYISEFVGYNSEFLFLNNNLFFDFSLFILLFLISFIEVTEKDIEKLLNEEKVFINKYKLK